MDRASELVDVARMQRERLADPQSGAPDHRYQSAIAQTERAAALGRRDQPPHLIRGQRLGRIAAPLIRRFSHGSSEKRNPFRYHSDRVGHASTKRDTTMLGRRSSETPQTRI